ncbi:MAG: hypothetical protein J6Z34_01590 [Clostridia bacterium]|nr:hypothetical protein [Clostridia bacterium]
MQRSKAMSYLGFARKSGNLKAGVNAVATLKSARLVIVCKTASANTVKEAEKLAARFSCPLMETGIPAEEIAGKENCKVVAVTDGNLARAIIDSSDENFTLKSGGCKK